MFTDLEVQEPSLDEAQEHFEEYLRSNYRGDTQKLYSIDVRQFLEFVEKQSIAHLGDIELNLINSFLSHIDAKNYSVFALHRKSAAIRAFFSYLTSAGYLETDPATALLLPERDKTLPRVLTTADRRKLLAVCADHPRNAAIIELLLETGIRLSELEKLSLADLSVPTPTQRAINMGSIYIQGYGKKQRTLPLSYDATRALNKWLSVRPKVQSPSLFVNRFGQPLNKRSIQLIVTNHLRAADIHYASVHTLRHTFAVQQIIEGKDVSEVQRLLGHEDTQYTKMYEIVAANLLEKELC